jgi:hypothetical protein
MDNLASRQRGADVSGNAFSHRLRHGLEPQQKQRIEIIHLLATMKIIMKKTSLKTFIIALVFGLCGVVFFRFGELEAQSDQSNAQAKRILEDGYYLSGGSAPLTNWDIAGVIFMIVACSLAFAALMIWRRNRNSE